MNEIITIRGGFKNVPEHLKTKTQLSKMGLKPAREAIAEVWTAHKWVLLYDIKDTKEKKKPTEKQLAALEKARITRVENERIKYQKEQELKWQQYQEEKEELKEYGLATFGKWKNEDFVILDTETTGLDDAEIVEIAIINKNGDVLFDSLIKPTVPIPADATYIHGITDSMVENSPTWKDVYSKIKEILKDRLVLIYNASFDSGVIYNSGERWGLAPISMNATCVMDTYAIYNGYDRWVSLANASGVWTSHRALDDCFSTFQVLKNVWDELEI